MKISWAPPSRSTRAIRMLEEAGESRQVFSNGTEKGLPGNQEGPRKTSLT